MSLQSLQSVGVQPQPFIGTWGDQTVPQRYVVLVSLQGQIDATPVASRLAGLEYLRWRAENWELSDEQRASLSTAEVSQLSKWYAALAGEEDDEGRTFVVIVPLGEPWWRPPDQSTSNGS